MKALELAETAETTMRPGGLADEVARELRRLAEVNAELVEALLQFADVCQAETQVELWASLDNAYKNAAKVAAKAKEQQ